MSTIHIHGPHLTRAISDPEFCAALERLLDCIEKSAVNHIVDAYCKEQEQKAKKSANWTPIVDPEKYCPKCGKKILLFCQECQSK